MVERSREERLEEAVADWWDRRARGEADATEAVLRAHPDLADTLAATLSSIDRSEHALELTRGVGEEVQPFADFRIVREIGRGGMGVVYEAEQHSMRRVVALKVLHPAVVLEPQAVERFRREAQAAGRIHHTNIVPVYAMGEDRGRWYFAMELVRGRTLAEVVRDLRALRAGPPGAHTPAFPTGGTNGTAGAPAARDFYARVALAFAGVADALKTAHQAGVIHRDVKPSNLILAEDGVVKLMDFGLAHAGGDVTSITVTGATLGTPAYMSPEQVRGAPHPIDGRTDVWSLGATLYELLTLRAPFLGGATQVLQKVLSQDSPPPRESNPRIPRDLETIVLKALEKDPSRRYRSAAELAGDLTSFAQGERIRAQRLGVAARAWRKVRRHKVRTAAVGAIVVLSAAVSWLWVRDAERRRLEAAREYKTLLLRGAQEGWGDRISPDLLGGAISSPQARRREMDLYDRAIEIDPRRPEAYVKRAQLESDLGTRLRLFDRARAAGLSERAYHLHRGVTFAGIGRSADALKERDLAASEAASIDDPEDEWIILVKCRMWKEAEAAITAYLRALPSGYSGHPSTLLARATAREAQGDLWGAVADVSSTMDRPGMDAPLRRIFLASLLRRLGQSDRAELEFAASMREMEGIHDAQEWVLACQWCVRCSELGWLERACEAGLARYPWEAGLQFHRGVLDHSRGAFDEALRHFALAESADPQYGFQCSLHRGEIAGARKDPEGLRRAGEALQRFGCLTGDLWVAATLLLEGKSAEAITRIRRAVDANPMSGEAQGALCRALVVDGRPEEALLAATRAIELEPSDRSFRLLRADLLVNQGKFEEADQDARSALGLDAQSAEAHVIRAQCLWSLGRTDDALGEADAAIRIAPEWARAHAWRGVILHQAGRYEAALASFETSCRLDPGDAHSWSNRLKVLFMLGRHEDVLRWVPEARKARPEPALDEEIQASEQRALAGLARWEAALTCVEDACAKFAASWWWATRAELQLQLGRYTDVLTTADEAERRFPAERKTFLEHRVQALERSSRGVELRRLIADSIADPALGLDPIQIARYSAIGGDPEKARAWLATAHPEDADGAYNVACIHALLGDVEGAVRNLELAVDRGVRVAPGDSDLKSLVTDPRAAPVLKRLYGR